MFCSLCSCNYSTLLWVIKPPRKFSTKRIPAAPDYALASSWHIANPTELDKEADVFFVHPTTYIKGKWWNQALDNETINQRTRVLPLRYQASLFYENFRMFVPKYRQAAFYSFVDKKDNGEQALEIAYQDVKAAFVHYLQRYNQGRPFIMASHSQGSFLTQRLLAEMQMDTAIQQQLIAAYLIGWPIEQAYFDSTTLVPCSEATQTGCVVSWNTEGKKNWISLLNVLDSKDSVLVINPLTWNQDTTYAAAMLNKGALLPDKNLKPEIILHYCDAQIKGGVLEVKTLPSPFYLQLPMGKGNYHLYDYSFFYENIKQNALERTAQHRDRQKIDK